MLKKKEPNPNPNWRFQDAWELEEGTVEELIEALKKVNPKAKVFHPDTHEVWQGLLIREVIILKKDELDNDDMTEDVNEGDILISGW